MRISFARSAQIESPLVRLNLHFRITSLRNNLNHVTADKVFDAFQTAVLNPTVSLLGKNVQILYLQINNITTKQACKLSYSQTFGLASSNSDLTLALLFELLYQSLRQYLRAPAAAFTKYEIPQEQVDALSDFENLFVRPLPLFSEDAAIRFEHRTNKEIISATLKSVATFASKAPSRTSSSKSAPKKPSKKVPKPPVRKKLVLAGA